MSRRPQFQKMLEDARAGKIDMILVKSASRFARNTVDLLGITRELSSIGVGVYFEKEKINSKNILSEMLLTVYAAFAQEESRNISENMKNGIRQRFELGIPKWALTYGLKSDGNDHWTVIEEEAKIIRIIFQLVLEGKGVAGIADYLNERGVRTPSRLYEGKKWNPASVLHIIRNEKFAGDVLMQKYYTVDRMVEGEFRFHDSIRNDKIKQYYVENHHPAIVSKDLFEEANKVLLMRDQHRGAIQYPYYGRLICPYCGKTMVRVPIKVGKTTSCWICGGAGSGFYYSERTSCPAYFVKEPYLTRAIRNILMQFDSECLGTENAEHVNQMQERLKNKETVEYIDLQNLVKSITFPDWDHIEITWKWGLKTTGDYLVDKPSDYPDPTIKKIDGRSMVGPFELSSRNIKQVTASMESALEKLSKVQIAIIEANGFTEPPLVGTDIAEKYEKTVSQKNRIVFIDSKAEKSIITNKASSEIAPSRDDAVPIGQCELYSSDDKPKMRVENIRPDGNCKEITTIYHKAQPVIRADGTIRDEKHLKVAAYARVSTLTEEQEYSYETQVKYFEQYIECNPDWTKVGIYADRGKSGRYETNRPGLKNMLEDCEAGKIDLILVRSISRFFRNCYKAQDTLKKLSDLDIEVRFLEGNISSRDPSAAMIIQLLTSVAENESTSISENVKWSYKKRAEQGIRSIGSNHVFGYDEINGVLVPNEYADVIRFAFESFANGMSYKDIRAMFAEMNITTMRSHNDYTTENLRRMFRNEIYVGDRLLQKHAPTSSNPNIKNGRKQAKPAYESKYIKNDHEAIVRRDTWEKVQKKMDRRKEIAKLGLRSIGEPHILLGKVFCKKCGTFMKLDKRYYRGALKCHWKCDEWLKREKGNGCRNGISDKKLMKEIAAHFDAELLDGKIVDEEVFQKIERIEICGGKADIFSKF